jgi:site-specific recombinase XerD
MSLDNEYAKDKVWAMRKRIAGDGPEREENLTQADRNILVEFDEQITRDRKRSNRCGWYHHCNLLTHLLVIAVETGVLADTLHDGQSGDRAFEEVLDWIHGQDYSGYTVQGVLSSLRVFADAVCDEMPSRFQAIKPSQHVDEDPAPLPSNIIEWADAVAMAEAADGTRDKALIVTQWDTGMRPMEELYTLQRKNVEFYDDHAVITLPERGKTDRHGILVLAGFPLLKQWIQEEHPVHDDPEASMGPDTFIWTRRNQVTHLRYNSMAERFRVAADAAGVTKDASAQHFRRSAASILARQPHISERDLRIRFSWSPNSDAPEHYIAAFCEATQKSVARCRGREVESIDESPDSAPVACPRCGDWTTRGMDECNSCSHNLDSEQRTFEEPMPDPQTAGEKDLPEMILDGDVTADELRTLEKLETVVKTTPDLFQQLDGYIEKAEALEAARDQSPSPVSAALGFPALVGRASSRLSRWARAKHAVFKSHSQFDDYPPTGRSAVGLAGLWAAFAAIIPAMLFALGDLGDFLAGDVGPVSAVLLGLTIGIMLVAREMPTVEDVVASLGG